MPQYLLPVISWLPKVIGGEKEINGTNSGNTRYRCMRSKRKG
jgi:hypothetical protein